MEFKGASRPLSHYFHKDTGILELIFESEELNDPDRVLKRILYYLAFIKLKKIFPGTKTFGQLTELFATVRGGGIILSNAIVRYEKWRGLSHYGWRISGEGFLNQRMYAYTLALLDDFREEANPTWIRYLDRDVKVLFDRCKKYIESTTDRITFLESDPAIPINEQPPPYLYLETIHYNDGSIQRESEMKNGLMDGSTRFYHSNGKFWAEWIYRNGIPYTVVSNFNSSGKPREKGNLKEGNGTLYNYNEKDDLIFIEYYENGKLVKRESAPTPQN